jgi:hypothetical protein
MLGLPLLDKNKFPKGIEITNEKVEELGIVRDKFH